MSEPMALRGAVKESDPVFHRPYRDFMDTTGGPPLCIHCGVDLRTLSPGSRFIRRIDWAPECSACLGLAPNEPLSSDAEVAP